VLLIVNAAPNAHATRLYQALRSKQLAQMPKGIFLREFGLNASQAVTRA
jgi:hypothetical protein